MSKLELKDTHLHPRESNALSQWGAFIHSLTRAGPNERYDDETGEWGTKAQVLGRMYSSRDEDDREQETFDDTDACIEMLLCVFKLPEQDRWILCGYWMHFNRNMTDCLKHIPSSINENPKFRYSSRAAFVDDVDRATSRAEALYRELYHDNQVKRMRSKFTRLKIIERNAQAKLDKL